MVGHVVRVAGPVVVARGLPTVHMYDVVQVGELKLIGEVIRLEGSDVTIQVYEDTTGIRVGEPVWSTQTPLVAELGPGLLGSIFDGLQRPLPELMDRSGPFIARGVAAPALPRDRRWPFTPHVSVGQIVRAGDVLGSVPEPPPPAPPPLSLWESMGGGRAGEGGSPALAHRVLVPPGISGTVAEIQRGDFDVETPIAWIETGDGTELVSSYIETKAIRLMQQWPVRQPRPARRKLDPMTPLITGQRVIDTFFPIAKGGTAIIPGGFGTGKCIPGDTPVLLSDGTLTPIQDIFEANRAGSQSPSPRPSPAFLLTVCRRGEGGGGGLERGQGEEFIHLNPGLRVMSFDGEGVVSRPCNGLYRGWTDTLVQVRTRSGRVFQVTPVHRLFVVTPELEIREVEAGELQPGDYLATPRRVVVQGSVQHLDYGNLFDAERQSSPVRLPPSLDEDFAEFLGFLLADGNLRPTTVVFYNNDETLLARFDELARRLFDLSGNRGLSNTVHCTQLCSKVLTMLLIHLGIPQSGASKSRTCRVPEIVMRSPDSHIQRFLGAYFACDGHVAAGGKELEFSTASHAMQIGLSYLLLRLGILHQLRQRMVKGRPQYRVYIRGKEEVGRFYQACAPQSWTSHKFDTIAAYLRDEKRNYTATDIVPISSRLFRECYEALGRPHAELEQRGVNPSNFWDGKFRMTARTFKAFADYAQIPRLSAFAHSLDHIFCDPITELKQISGSTSVYDLTVPGTHNFVGGAGAVLFHNTIMEQTLAKWADADIMVYVGCGERGNEMTEVLAEFPELEDPRTGAPLMNRTVLIANTSNMPVAAREASIYTGITIAEYYRDMGYSVALLADSTSRWGEALREVSGRLEEMPAEEGYPAYLGARLAHFYERAGRVVVQGSEEREGSVTIIGAVSPPGGDFSEPMTQSSLRVAGTFWALDTSLARRRHFPAINWRTSFSLHDLDDWFDGTVSSDWSALTTEAMSLLQQEEELLEIVQLVGADALAESERAILAVARRLREDFLQQSASDPVDSFCPPQKTCLMLRALLTFRRLLEAALARGVPLEKATAMPEVQGLSQVKRWPVERAQTAIPELINEIERALGSLMVED
jgi:V/A-type H+-transporting ATPase subunit A